jgi:hypothetical protein
VPKTDSPGTAGDLTDLLVRSLRGWHAFSSVQTHLNLSAFVLISNLIHELIYQVDSAAVVFHKA